VSIERPAVYIVATPIGNLGDLSARAVEVLSAVDIILCEDTRHSRRLLDHYAIARPLAALHDHNEAEVAGGHIERMRERKHACALISDAGTPLISDPGFALVRAAHAAAVPVFAIPGACAAIAALSIAGLPCERFAYEGFLPSQAAARARALQVLAHEPRTLVFYEAPHRIAATLAAMRESFGADRDAAVGRELTKRYESLYRGPLGELSRRIAGDKQAARGEFVIVVAGAAEQTRDDAELERIVAIVRAHADLRTAVRIASELTGAPRNRVYELALRTASRGNDPIES
jgi:16S rRNA (cytidine1402-2'-O)-methyltransferase